MINLALKILLIINIVVVAMTGCELVNPLREETESVSQVIPIQRGTKINFTTYYRYGYYIQLKIENANETQWSDLRYKLIVDGHAEITNDRYRLGDSLVNIGSFSANKDDQCSIELLDVGNEVHGQKGLLIIDVSGGGPSVGNYWAKEMRSAVKKIFFGSLIISIVLILVISRKRMDKAL